MRDGSRDVVEDRSPQVVGHDHRVEGAAGDGKRRPGLEVVLDQLDDVVDARRSSTPPRSRSIATTRAAAIAEPARVAPSTARDVEHGAADRDRCRRTGRSTPTGSRRCRRGRFGAIAHSLDHEVGEQEDHRQPHDVVDVVERGPASRGRPGSRGGTAAPRRRAHSRPSATGAPSVMRKRSRGTAGHQRDQRTRDADRPTSSTSTAPITPTPSAPHHDREHARRVTRRDQRVLDLGRAVVERARRRRCRRLPRFRRSARNRHSSSATAEIPSAIHTVRCGVHVSVTEKLPEGGSTRQPLA